MYLRTSRFILWNKVEIHKDRSEIMHLSINERTTFIHFMSEYMNLCHLGFYVCKSIEIHRWTPATYFAPINGSNGKMKNKIWGSCTIFLINKVLGKKYSAR